MNASLESALLIREMRQELQEERAEKAKKKQQVFGLPGDEDAEGDGESGGGPVSSMKGIDGVLIGPHDLSCSLGLPEQYDHPTFLKAAETILTKARNAGIGAGVHYWGTTEESTRLIGMGANLFIHKADAIFLREGLHREIEALREALGEESADGGRQVNI